MEEEEGRRREGRKGGGGIEEEDKGGGKEKGRENGHGMRSIEMRKEERKKRRVRERKRLTSAKESLLDLAGGLTSLSSKNVFAVSATSP